MLAASGRSRLTSLGGVKLGEVVVAGAFCGAAVVRLLESLVEEEVRSTLKASTCFWRYDMVSGYGQNSSDSIRSCS